MGRVIERTFSGYRLNLPERLKLVVVDFKTGKRYRLEDLDYWMRQPLWVIYEELREGWLDDQV